MNNNQVKIVYVEDDLNLSMVVKDFLLMQAYEVFHFESAEALISNWKNIDADICLLDVMLPGMDGYELAKYIKQRNEDLPIVFLSAKTQIKDKIQGLELGADDYITKPFSTLELDLRIKAIIKRASKNNFDNSNTAIKMQFGDVIYDEKEFLIINPKGSHRLTKKENQLLKQLISNKNNIVKRDDLLNSIWGEVSYQNSRSMDVYISKIRKMIAPESKISIINYHSTGFKFDTTNLNKD